MENKNEIVQVGDGIYQIKYFWLGMANVYMFLVVGEEKALLIDTGYSITNAIGYVQQVTDKPVVVVNTHGHFDHIGGNGDFEEVYMSERDLLTAKQHSDHDFLKGMMDHFQEVAPPMRMLFAQPGIGEQMEQSLRIAPCKYLPLPETGYFDLGGRKVSYIETPGHTQGSICLWDEKTKTFFPGDMMCEGGVLLGFDHSTSVSEYKASIEKMRDFFRSNGGKAIFASHHQVPVNHDIFERDIALCDKIIADEIKGEYIDDGLSQGLCVKDNGLQIIYNRV